MAEVPDKPLSAREQRERARAAAAAYRLKSGESAADGAMRVARSRVEKASGRLRNDAREDLPGAVHGARKDLKKVRAVLRLVRGGLGRKAYRRETRRYRDAGRLLSGARDAEVKLQTLRAVQERYPDEAPAAEWLVASLAAERGRLSDGDGSADARPGQAVAAIEDGQLALADLRLDGSGWELVGPGVERTYRSGRRRLADVRADPTPEAVHEWRKRVKDLWYQVRLLREAWPGVMKGLADELGELGELLGDHNDLSVLAAEVRGANGGGPELPALLELIERRQGEILPDALAIGERVYAEPPGRFADRFSAYWRAWRPDGD